MRRGIPTVVALALVILARTARADDCLDASDRARAELGQKHLLEARSQLRLCAAQACDASVRAICDERLGEVAARIPTIIFDAKDGEGRDLAAVRLSIDGALRSEGPLGEEIALDPGGHVFLFEAPGQPPVERRFVLVEREKGRREHVVFAPPESPPPAPPPAPPVVVAPPPPSRLRTAGWITIGAGAVGLGIGTAFGVLAVVKNDDAGCDASNVCDDPRSRHDARSAATVSTVAFVAGAALAATGVVLVVLGNRSTSLHASPGGVGISARF